MSKDQADLSRRESSALPRKEVDVVSLLMQPRSIAPYLLQAVEGKEFRPAAASRGDWRVEDFKYEPGEYCSVLYQFEDRWIIGFITWPADPSAQTDPDRWVPELNMQVYAFPEEPAMPMLPAALDPEYLKESLSAALPEVQSGEARIIHCRVTPVRFRPGKRCTVRIELWMREARSHELRRVVLYGKIYHKLDKARQVYKEMQVLSESRAAREGKVILARPRVMIDELGMILQEQVNGDLLVLALDCRTAGREPRAVQGLQKAAEALSAVHYSGIKAGQDRPISRELSRFKHRARNIGRVNPALADLIIACADAQARRLEELDEWGAENTVVHGDCKPSQFLTGSSGTAILDFDHVGMADPAVDVGTFLATLRQMACRHAYRTKGRSDPCFAAASELEDLFLSAYCEAEEVHSGFHYRAIWYESVGLVRKAIRSFERSPFSGLPMQLVSEAEHVLDRLTDGNSQTSSKIWKAA